LVKSNLAANYANFRPKIPTYEKGGEKVTAIEIGFAGYCQTTQMLAILPAMTTTTLLLEIEVRNAR
jgi:hypothetical protein